MNKILLLLTTALWALSLGAQTITLRPEGEIPAAAQEVLVQRFTQMIQQGGVSVGESPWVLSLSVEETDRMETSGSVSQTALSLEVRATLLCEGREEPALVQAFPVKGVGSDRDDAVLRAMKQILPRSKSSRAFVQALITRLQDE